jgi:hypothetical protein
MALLQNNVAKGSVKMPQPGSAELVAFRMSFSLAADITINDIIEMGNLPAGCVPVDLVMDCDDMDSGATGTVSFGVLNTGKTDLDVSAANGGAAWLAATSIQASTATRADAAGLRAMSRVVSNPNADRPIGFKLVTEAVAAANQVIGATLYYRAN